MTHGTANRFELSACVAELGSLRYTPAGLPALDLQLEHESSVMEATLPRVVKMSIRAVAIGAIAERLAGQALGSRWLFRGFLATRGRSKQPVLHVQDFQQD